MTFYCLKVLFARQAALESEAVLGREKAVRTNRTNVIIFDLLRNGRLRNKTRHYSKDIK